MANQYPREEKARAKKGREEWIQRWTLKSESVVLTTCEAKAEGTFEFEASLLKYKLKYTV